MKNIIPLFLLLLNSCIYSPQKFNYESITQNSISKTNGNVTVEAAVLSSEQAEEVFDLNLSLRRIQAVWVRVKNNDSNFYWLMNSGLDPDYYSPNEVAYSGHKWFQTFYNDAIDVYFDKVSFKNPIPPNSETEGFIFVNYDEGEKAVNIDLIAPQKFLKFAYTFNIKGLRKHTFEEVIHSYKNKYNKISAEEELRELIENLPSHTTGKDNNSLGDPLNLIVIGNPQEIFPALVSRDWHSVEDTYWGSIWKTINSFIFGRRYRYSPVSPLYYEGREQDISFQKARGTIHQRNHMRLWLTPHLYKEKHLWIGQISRDIGVRFTSKTKTLVTHKIDPDIDETRVAFIEDMLFSQFLESIAFGKGSKASTKNNPSKNLTDDPYFTDGLRAVFFFSETPKAITEIKFLNWESPGGQASEYFKQ